MADWKAIVCILSISLWMSGQSHAANNNEFVSSTHAGSECTFYQGDPVEYIHVGQKLAREGSTPEAFSYITCPIENTSFMRPDKLGAIQVWGRDLREARVCVGSLLATTSAQCGNAGSIPASKGYAMAKIPGPSQLPENAGPVYLQVLAGGAMEIHSYIVLWDTAE